MRLFRFVDASCGDEQPIVFKENVDAILNEPDDLMPIGKLNFCLPGLESHVNLFEGAVKGQVEDWVNFAQLGRTVR